MSVRIDKKIKERLSEIADDQRMSLSELSANALSSFVSNYFPDNIDNFEIPDAFDAYKIRKNHLANLKHSAWLTTKKHIKSFLEEAREYALLPDNEIPLSVKVFIEESLSNLGYFVHRMVHDVEIEISPDHPAVKASSGDILVALDEKDIRDFVRKDLTPFDG